MRSGIARTLAFAVLAGAGAGIWALVDEPQPDPVATAQAQALADDSANAADDAAIAAAAAAAEEAAKAAAAAQAVDAAVEAAAEKAGVSVEPETIVPVGAEPVEVSPPLAESAATPPPLPEITTPQLVSPVPLPPPAPPAAATAPRPRPVRPKADPLKGLAADATAAEIEAVLAQAPQTYLVLDVSGATLSVKARGVTLDQVPIRAAHLLHGATLLGRGERETPATPSVWKVAEAPEDLTRELIAPAELKPYVPEDEREEPEKTTTAGPASKIAEEELKPPANYRVRLDRGWELAVLERSPRRGFLRRFADAARSGWAEVIGRPIAHPPTFAVTVDEDDARRIHHLFRADTAVLLTASRR